VPEKSRLNLVGSCPKTESNYVRGGKPGGGKDQGGGGERKWTLIGGCSEGRGVERGERSNLLPLKKGSVKGSNTLPYKGF